jgi:hypothetical protein
MYEVLRGVQNLVPSSAVFIEVLKCTQKNRRQEGYCITAYNHRRQFLSLSVQTFG